MGKKKAKLGDIGWTPIEIPYWVSIPGCPEGKAIMIPHLDGTPFVKTYWNAEKRPKIYKLEGICPQS